MSTEKDINSTNRHVKPFNEAIYKANLSVIPKEQHDYFNKIKSTPVPVENDVSIAGLKNPITVVIYGFSTRNVFDSLKRSHLRNDIVYIVEPNPGNLKAVMEREYIGDILNNPNVELLVGIPQEELSINIYKEMAKSNTEVGSRPAKSMNPEIICDPFLYTHDQVQHVVNAVTEASKQLFTSMGCSSDTFARWENSIRNEKNMQSGFQTTPFFDAFKGKPCIVLGGGPSIETFIKVYKEKKWENKIVVIACDAILRRLLIEGIKPHFVMRCERKLTTIFEGVTRDKTDDIFYFGYPWTPPEYFDLFKNFSVVTRDNGICHNMGFDIGSLNGGVSAANACFELAAKMGCSPILMSGIDLCFIGDKSHVDGTIIEFDVEKSKSKWVDVPNNKGTQSKTIPVWARCRGEYEAAIFKHKLKNVYNTSEDGVKIALTEFKPLTEFNFGMEFPILETIRSLQIKVPECNWLNKKREMINCMHSWKKDFEKLFSFLDDTMVVANTEESKSIHQLFSEKYSKESFYNNVRGIRKSLAVMYSEPLRQINVLKDRIFSDKRFCELILDTMQVDFFHCENKMASLSNCYKNDSYEMNKAIVELNFSLFRLAHKLLLQMIELFENGVGDKTYKVLVERLMDSATIHLNKDFDLLYEKHRKIANKLGREHSL